ncbi:MAG: hypothetical protein U9R79_17200 [Armatimonadota bacterium]|nr:hypothetical protein [Armatimonadota bacterium]
MTGEGRTEIYRIGPPLAYLYGGVLLPVAAGIAVGHVHTDYLWDEDRLVMAGIAALTFGGLAAWNILRAYIPAVILADERLCIREWYGTSRCVPLDRIQRVTWSFHYAAGGLLLDSPERAWLEVEVMRESGRLRRLVVDYGGRRRHGEMQRLVRELSLRARLRWADGNSLDGLTEIGGEVVLER